MNRSQRVRKGFLSDDNVMRRCPTAFSQAGARTYGLLKIDGKPNELAQRPQRADQMINGISKRTGASTNSLESQYVKSINSLPINPMVVVSSPVPIPALPTIATPMSMVSRPYSRAATPLEAPSLLRLTDESERMTAKARVPLPRGLGDGFYDAVPAIASPFISISTLGDNVAKVPKQARIGLTAADRKDKQAELDEKELRQKEAFINNLSPSAQQLYNQLQATGIPYDTPLEMTTMGRSLKKQTQLDVTAQLIERGLVPEAERARAEGELRLANLMGAGTSSDMAQTLKSEYVVAQNELALGLMKEEDSDESDVDTEALDRLEKRINLAERSGDTSPMTKAEGKKPVPFGRSGNFTITQPKADSRVNITVFAQGGRDVRTSTRDNIQKAMSTPMGSGDTDLADLD